LQREGPEVEQNGPSVMSASLEPLDPNEAHVEGASLLFALCRHGRGRAQCALMKAKRTLPARFSEPIVYQRRLSRLTVILPDDHKQALCTDPSPGPLSLVVVGKCKLNQLDRSVGRLMHNHPGGDPTPS
jgi:hypothetical protein